MRLGQLSRKLNVSIPEIVTIVADEFGVTIGDHPNIKLDDSYVDYISNKFNKSDVVIKTKEALDKEADLKPSDDVETLVEESVNEVENEQEVEAIENSATEEPPKEIETIRAKAAKLEGLKVVDKIELPEPPPPVMVEIDGVMYDKAELKKQRIAERKERDANRKKEAAKREAAGKKRVKKKPVKKELSFSEKRRIEEKRERELKHKEEKFKRKRQKKHYESKHKIIPPVNKKKKEKVVAEIEEVVIETRPEPKTLLGKFWRWLNTY